MRQTMTVNGEQYREVSDFCLPHDCIVCDHCAFNGQSACMEVVDEIAPEAFGADCMLRGVYYVKVEA